MTILSVSLPPTQSALQYFSGDKCAAFKQAANHFVKVRVPACVCCQLWACQRSSVAMTSQLPLQGCQGTLPSLHTRGRALLPPYSSRRADTNVAAQAAQQQARPVFIDDKGTATFLEWARSQGGLSLNRTAVYESPSTLTWHNYHSAVLPQQRPCPGLCTLVSTYHRLECWFSQGCSSMAYR